MSEKKANGIDNYRVSLFKKKLRELIPDVEKVRFTKSIGETRLIFKHERYKDPESVRTIVSEALGREQIDFNILCPFPKWFPDHTYFSIPIDQEALPERKRMKNAECRL